MRNRRVTPPPFRFDIAIEEDLVEEIGRLFGYDAIPATPGEVGERLGTASEHIVETVAEGAGALTQHRHPQIAGRSPLVGARRTYRELHTGTLCRALVRGGIG